jgi:hypothetical protein
MASITAMFLSASSSETGTSAAAWFPKSFAKEGGVATSAPPVYVHFFLLLM